MLSIKEINMKNCLHWFLGHLCVFLGLNWRDKFFLKIDFYLLIFLTEDLNNCDHVQILIGIVSVSDQKCGRYCRFSGFKSIWF